MSQKASTVTAKKAAVGKPASQPANQPNGGDGYKMYSPIVMTPISQMSTGVRRPARQLPGHFSENPDDYNPDGSLRTELNLPKTGNAFDQASQTRYLRHRDTPEWEKSLSVNEIFDKKK